MPKEILVLHQKYKKRPSWYPFFAESDGNSLGKAELLNQQFIIKSVFTNEPAGDLPNKGPSPHSIMPDITISLQGAETYLMVLKSTKQVVLDAISAKILKETSDIIAPVLQTIILFQISLDTGRVPVEWTSAFLAPIFKKGSRNVPSNYRSVSLTCITSKIFECIMKIFVIMKHLESNNILYNFQCGFHQGRSCKAQLISLLDDLTFNYNRSLQTDLIITDFAKAFDVVYHIADSYTS